MTCAAVAQREYRHHEKNVPAQQNQACTHTRVSRSLSHPWRSCRSGFTPTQGQGPPQRLSSSAVRHFPLSQTVVDSSCRAADVSSAAQSQPPCFEFPRDARLLDGKAYSSVFKRNRRVADSFFTVLVHRRTGDVPARLGLAIAKKRAKRAVDRNRIKRVSRESFRHHQLSLLGLDLVVMNREGATRASAAQLRSSLDQLWSQALKASQPGRR